MKCTDIHINCVCIFLLQVSAEGLQSIPLNLAVSWRCEPNSTDLRIDYKYNGEAMTTPMALNNVQFLVSVDGGVSKLQAVLPPAAWYSPRNRITERAVSPLRWFNFDFQLFFCHLVNLYRNAEQRKILWKIPDISQKSENGGMYSLMKETNRILDLKQSGNSSMASFRKIF